jgi:hypothetical protein
MRNVFTSLALAAAAALIFAVWTTRTLATDLTVVVAGQEPNQCGSVFAVKVNGAWVTPDLSSDNYDALQRGCEQLANQNLRWAAVPATAFVVSVAAFAVIYRRGHREARRRRVEGEVSGSSIIDNEGITGQATHRHTVNHGE